MATTKELEDTIQHVIFALSDLKRDAFDYGDKELFDFAINVSSSLEKIVDRTYDVIFVL